MSTEMALQAAFLVWLITILAGGLGWLACDGLAWCVRRIRARRARIEAVRQRYRGILS